MAQSYDSNQMNPQNNPTFWHKHTTQPPMERSKWIVGLQMAIFAKENRREHFALQSTHSALKTTITKIRRSDRRRNKKVKARQRISESEKKRYEKERLENYVGDNEGL